MVFTPIATGLPPAVRLNAAAQSVASVLLRLTYLKMVDMWQWLHDLSPGQATFLGWVVGFITLVGGALLNAYLNRRRDDQLRREDQRALATALRAELEELRRALSIQTESLEKKAPPDAGYRMSDLSQLIRIMPEMVPKFGLLDQETILSVMDAYAFVE